MRSFFVAGAALMLLGCYAPPADVERQQALKAYDRCLHSAARTLDDHRSEASAIAAVVVKKCSGERAITAAMLNDLPQEITAATTIVLDERNRDSK